MLQCDSAEHVVSELTDDAWLMDLHRIIYMLKLKYRHNRPWFQHSKNKRTKSKNFYHLINQAKIGVDKCRVQRYSSHMQNKNFHRCVHRWRHIKKRSPLINPLVLGQRQNKPSYAILLHFFCLNKISSLTRVLTGAVIFSRSEEKTWINKASSSSI